MGQSHPKAAECEVLGRRLGRKKLEEARQSFREICGLSTEDEQHESGSFFDFAASVAFGAAGAGAHARRCINVNPPPQPKYIASNEDKLRCWLQR